MAEQQGISCFHHRTPSGAGTLTSEQQGIEYIRKVDLKELMLISDVMLSASRTTPGNRISSLLGFFRSAVGCSGQGMCLCNRLQLHNDSCSLILSQEVQSPNITSRAGVDKAPKPTLQASKSYVGAEHWARGCQMARPCMERIRF